MIRILNSSPMRSALQTSLGFHSNKKALSSVPKSSPTGSEVLNSFQAVTESVQLTPQQKADLLDLEAEIFVKQGRYTDALSKFQEALKLKQLEGYAFSNLRVAQSYRNLGAVYYCLGRYEDALKNHELALRMRQTALGENHVLTSDSYENMGVVYRAKGDFSLALDYLNKALEIRRKLEYSDGTMDRSICLKVANSLYDIACVYRDTGNFQEALKFHHEALNIRRTYLLDPSNPQLIESELAIKELELKLGIRNF